jgi:hypothetical protein
VATDNEVLQAFNRVAALSAAHAKPVEGTGKFAWNGRWVHLFGQ